jgi:uncharacterized membrane protein YecN with MAPEG domain
LSVTGDGVKASQDYDKRGGAFVPSITLPIVSGLTAGILIAIQMVLMLGVIFSRRKNRQSLSDGSHPGLLRAMRRHGNFAENAAIFIAGLTLLELMGASRREVEVIAAIFVAGRLSHAIGLSLPKTVNTFRMLGATATVFVGFSLGVRLVSMALPLI